MGRIQDKTEVSASPQTLHAKLYEEIAKRHRFAGAYLDAELNLLEANGLEAFIRQDVPENAANMLQLFPEILARKIGHLAVVARRTSLSQQEEIEIEQQGIKRLLKVSLYPPDTADRCLLILEEFQNTDGETASPNIISDAFLHSPSALLMLRPLYDDAQEKIIDFYCIASNHAADLLFGEDSASLTGKNITAFSHRPEIWQLEKHFRYVFKTGTTERFNFVIPQSDVNVRGYDVLISKMQGHLSLSLTDATESQQAQERLRVNYNQLMQTRQELRALNATLEETIRKRTQEMTESEERFRLVANATTDAIYDWELSTGTHWWSNGLFTQFGYEVEEIKNGRLFWESHLHPDDKLLVKLALTASIQKDTSWRMEYRFRKADGTYAWVLDRANIVSDTLGIPYRMLGSILDISAIRAANRAAEQREAEYFHLADSLPHIVWAADEQGVVMYTNRQWEAFTGGQLKLPAQLIAFRPFVHPDDFIICIRKWLHALQEETSFETECRLREKYSGDYRWFSIRAQKNNYQGETIRWHGVCIDIHDRKISNAVLEQRVAARTAELETANRELADSNNELQQFASVTSHDLKEPLRKIQIFGKMIREKAIKEENGFYIDSLNRIVSSSERLTVLINDLLSFSRLSVNVPMQYTDLNEIIGDILTDLDILILEKNAQIHVSKFPTIWAVPAQMRQLFQNLISNALKFSRPGVSPIIQIRAEAIATKDFNALKTHDGKFVHITISDNGIGFDEQYLDKIFTLFQRLHTRTAYEGTGIGLAIVKKIVNRHDGLITASSEEGTGALFEIILPISEVPTEQQ